MVAYMFANILTKKMCLHLHIYNEYTATTTTTNDNKNSNIFISKSGCKQLTIFCCCLCEIFEVDSLI